MKLLIVEDEKEIRKSIVQYLSGSGYLVESVSSVKEADDKLAVFEYDCVVLDLMLPDGSGLDVLMKIKANHPKTGVLILSAKDSLNDKIKGLDLGADDYLPKPFHFEELMARIKSIIRRRSFAGGNIIEFKEIKIDVDARQVFIFNQDAQITGKEFDILLFLITNKNKVISKNSIAEHVWGDFIERLDSVDFLYTHIKNLRKKMTSMGCGDYIKSIYSVGYKFSE
ncbi:MAG: response regulator transcription factor [Cytophagales bacterium]